MLGHRWVPLLSPLLWLALSSCAAERSTDRRLLFARLFDKQDTVVAGGACQDNNEDCENWARGGECDKNPGYMHAECAMSCKRCTPLPNATRPKRRRLGSGCEDEEDFSCAAKAEAGGCDTDKGEMLTKCPQTCKVCSHMSTILEAFGCDDKHASCKSWASAGECKANPSFMHEQCTESCQTCEEKRRACNRPPNTPPAIQPGDISTTYQRILRDFPQYNPQIVSEPSTPVAKVRSSKHPSPWVVTLENFINDEEVAAFISGCSDHFDRSLAGDQLSPVRTSQQCWCSSWWKVPSTLCSDNKCARDPVTQRVAERISNVTRAPVRYMEPFQILKYEVGQFYKTHHDQNSGLFTPQGVRVYTFFMYLSTPEAGGGTRFDNLDVVVPAVKGNAVMWPSVTDADPTQDEPHTFHQGLPPERGVKYAANVWVHNFDYRTPAGSGCLLTHKNTH